MEESDNNGISAEEQEIDWGKRASSLSEKGYTLVFGTFLLTTGFLVIFSSLIFYSILDSRFGISEFVQMPQLVNTGFLLMAGGALLARFFLPVKVTEAAPEQAKNTGSAQD